ncbi:transmembrane protein 59 isoform X2 [Tiliqua scincoides]|uniref:transmembrane protein 59 isoform X2 n=1 Tax=Tiliqua scincoides TaxID=71010 RepID=UPI003462002A
MAPRWLGASSLLLLALSCAGTAAEGAPARDALPEVFEPALGSTSPCQRTCRSTYPLHTYPKEEELYACQRGCRLFSICQFVDDGIDLNRTKLECDSACSEAYFTRSDEQYACHLGCQNQLPYAKQRQEELMSSVPRMHLLFPLTFVRSFWSDMMDTAHSFITSSWTFYLQVDDGKIVIYQSKPEVQFIESPEQETMDFKESSLNKASYLQPDGPQRHNGFFEEDENENFFKCISVNSGWILTTTLVLSVLVLLWICCATVTTAAEQYVPSEKLSICGDLEYMNEQKLNRYPSSALVVVKCKANEQEAGPLPKKVNLTQSAI